MHLNTIDIVLCIAGIISCLIGVSTFVSAQVTKAKQDGVLIAKIEQCVRNTEEIKKDIIRYEGKKSRSGFYA